MKNYLPPVKEKTQISFSSSGLLRPSLLIAILAFVAFPAETQAQTAKVTLAMNNATIGEVIDNIETSTDYKFLFNTKAVDLDREVTVKARNKRINKVLNQLFSDGNTLYEIIDDKILLSKTEGRKNVDPVQNIHNKRPYQVLTISQKIPAHTVAGTITDSDGEPLIGANILEKGTSNGVIADIGGRYSIDVADENSILVLSYIGYITTEVPVNGQTSLNITLEESAESLEEIVVVGYGTVKKSDLTGAVSSVNSEELTAYPATDAVQAMQGRASGVNIQSTNGEPGTGYKIRVRGATSINASSDPLFVVDGLVGAELPPPEDIISIEVLKDASSTAIYGSRGANGVVLVSTRTGTTGKVRVNFNNSYSTQKEIGRLDVLGARDFAEYINEARNTEFYDLNNLEADTDWQELIFQPGHIQNHQLSVSGGNSKMKYYVSGVYYDQVGVIKTSEYERLSLNSNINFAITNKIDASLSTLIMSTTKEGVQSQSSHGGGDDGGVVTAAQRFEPAVGILDENGDYNDSKIGVAPVDNPMAVIDGRDIENKGEIVQSNFKVNFGLVKGLDFTSTFGFIFRNSRNAFYNSRIVNAGETNNGYGQINNNRNFSFLSEQYLNYQFQLGRLHKFDLTGGYSYQSFKNENFMARNAGFISDGLGYWNLSAGTNIQIPDSGTSESEIASFYGRFNYNLGDRYLFTFTGRYDGASQFSEGNKWSFFPSGAFSWNVSNEPFYPETNVLSSLKFRTSYGQTGNQAIGPYRSLAGISPTFFVLNGGIANSVRPTSIANKDLTWETTTQFNIGVDLEMFLGRVNLTADYYRKETTDLLYNVPIPSFSGYTNRLENIGSIESKGFEFMLNTKNLVGEFKWSTTVNLTINRSKVLSLPQGNDIIYAGAPGYLINGALQHAILREGSPIGSFYGYIYEGVYQEGDDFVPGGGFETAAGGEKFTDLDGNGSLNNNDRQIIGDPNPDAIWGFNNDFSFKGFDLNIFFLSYVGGDIINFAKMELDRLSGNSNATVAALDRWTPTNRDTDVPKATAGRVSKVSTRFVEDGSFVRLKNVALGYNFTGGFLERIGISNVRAYVSGQNLWTSSNYSGVDPEVAYKSTGATNSNINLGLDYGSYPNTTSYTFGLNIGF